MADKKSIVIPFVISYKEYRLYRWYSLMKENSYKFSDYIKYVLFCSLKNITCNVGTVYVNDLQVNESIRTSITITVNDGILYDWIIDIDNSPVIRKSVLIKSVLSNAIAECALKSDEYIPSYAELDLGPLMSNKYARYNTKDNSKKRDGVIITDTSEAINQKVSVKVTDEKEDSETKDSIENNKTSVEEKVNKEQQVENSPPLADDNKRREMESFLANYSVGGVV